MITIIADRFAAAAAPAGALLARCPADYVEVRCQIKAALVNFTSLTVYVTDPVVLCWLSDLQRYPASHLCWHEVDPCEQFRSIFHVAPTEPFTRELIAQLRLDTLAPPPPGLALTPLSWLLGQRLDLLWQHDQPPPNHAAAVAAWALTANIVLAAPLLTLVQAQLERWEHDAPCFIALRAASLEADSRHLLLRWALRHYNHTWQAEQPWAGLPLLKEAPPSAAVEQALSTQSTLLHNYWQRFITQQSADPACINTALGQMSGLSSVELEVLSELLNHHPELLDQALLTRIKRHFAHLSSSDAILAQLANRIVPATPNMPDAAWPVERWLTWATQEYLPFYRWVVQTGCQREHQQACALHYSDWLYQHYQSLINDDRSPILTRQYQEVLSRIHDEPETVVFWLVVDGMTWWQGALMRKACEQRDLHTVALRPGLAALPSLTSVSKWALVTGQTPRATEEPTLAAAARAKLARSSIPACVSYDAHEALAALRKEPELRVVLLLDTMLDTIAHQCHGFTDHGSVRGHLDELAQTLAQAQQICTQHGRRLLIFIGSDHGATLLPPTAASTPLPKMVREVSESWESGQPAPVQAKPSSRAAVSQLEAMPAIDETRWYPLDRERFQLDRHYLVPRGYHYIKRRPSGWTHGGLTPEETIVPLMQLSGSAVAMLPLELVVQGELRARRAGTLTMLIQNHNPFPIENLHWQISGGPPPGQIAILGPNASQTISISFPPINPAGDTFTINYTLDFSHFGKPEQNSGMCKIRVQHLYIQDEGLEDMFD
ncbi:PglZ domain-containing protein [Candidatus Viridilinea mediisalina]|uniref:Uncharacterized protein n=1 Tax=Candidatus Viridilinea mediisalina TaxID=2024553 RepID=A0A2A6RK58_9CHLR|nr:PglZ domain-containing protein [Candidatus Viridilinea mediisalina]PDW03276.1 hypothetical protein CJ255_09525 [Candidatus Viridilinea mediisalina]